MGTLFDDRTPGAASLRRAVGYIRVSGDEQADKGGPDRQREKMAACAAKRGFEIVQWFEDLGVSGAKELIDRPGLGALLIATESNGFEAVFIEKLDRLARDLVIQESIIADFQGRGFTLISVDEGDELLSNDPSRKLIRQIFGAIAEYDRQMLVLKLAAGRARRKALTGRGCGRMPFGLKPGEAEVRDRIMLLRDEERMLWEDIAATLNAEGVKTRTGGPWQLSTLYGIWARETKKRENERNRRAEAAG